MFSRPAIPRSPSCERRARWPRIGAGMNQSAMLADLVRHTDVDLLMLAGRYTLLEQDSLDDLLPLCERRGVGVVAAGVFNSGLLARSQPTPDVAVRLRRRAPDLLARASAIAAVCDRHGTTLPAAAIAFPLAHPAVAERVRGRALAAADGAERGTASRADPARPVERAEGGGTPARGRPRAGVIKPCGSRPRSPGRSSATPASRPRRRWAGRLPLGSSG